MKKRLLAIFLTLAMVLTMLPTTAFAANQSSFNDVASTAWYYDAVNYVSSKGIMSGVGNGNFSPEKKLTRAQLCQILYNMEGKPVANSGSFTDVSANDWFKDAVNWAAANEIVNGTGNGQFSPNKDISREQVVTILYRYAKNYKNYNMGVPVSLEDYSDKAKINTWAEEAMKWAVSEHIISGTTDTTISPQGTATRAQAATMLMRFCKNIEDNIAFESKDIDDFGGHDIINFDDSEETNFAVLTEGTVVATSTGGKNRLVSSDDDNGLYKFENTDEDISNLQAGDVFYYPYGNGVDEYVLLKVDSIDVLGDTVTLTAAKSEISDFFEYIDIDMDIDVTEDELNVQNMSDALALVSNNALDSNVSNSAAAKSRSFKETFKISVDKELSDGGKLSGTLEGITTVTVKMRYDPKLWGKDYFEIKVTVQDQLDANVQLSVSGTRSQDTFRWIIGSLLVPIGSTGCWVDGDLYFVFDVDANADIKLESSLTATIGFQYDTNNGYKKIAEFDSDDSLDPEGKLNISLGIGTDVGVEFVKIAKASIEGTAGFEIDAKTTDCGISKDKGENHLCVFCVDGAINAFAELAFKCKFGVSEKVSVTPVNASVKLKKELATFYASFLNGTSDAEFGWGECPHKQYLVTIVAEDQVGSKIAGAFISLTNEETGFDDATGKTTENGVFKTYCDNGNYSINIFLDGYHCPTGSVSVQGKPASINLTMLKETNTIINTGTCGENLTWTLDEDGTLTISGTGPMEDYYFNANAPWHEQRIKITTVVINNGVTSIGYNAFNYCTGLTSVTIPNSVTNIGDWAFSGCTGLTSVTIPNSVTSIGWSTFSGCTGLTSVTIPNSVTDIGFRAFGDCNSLASVTIPNSVTDIGDSAFFDCTGLTSVTIPNSVTDIGDSAFSGCTGLTSVIIPNSVTYIGGSAFSRCTGLTSVTIPNSVTNISFFAFEDCTGLTSVTIPNSVTSIGDYAFRNCTDLTSVVIPDSVTSIGDLAFWNCTGLTSVTIPNSVINIGRYAFSNCTGLTSVTIPNSVTSIGWATFSDCTSLKDVYFTGSETQWKGIEIDTDNDPLTSATIHYNSTGT